MTRLYTRENASTDITPNVDAAWESSASPFAQRPLLPTTDGTDTLTTVSGFGSTAGQDRCHRQLISPPLAAGLTFDTGVTYKCYVQALESAANDNIRSRLGVRILSADGSTVRHTVLAVADYSTATEWNTALRNKAFADGDAGAGSYTTVVGDRLVAEVGHNDASGASISGSSRWGSAGTADLGENETSTSTAERPWFDTSLTLHWAALPTAIGTAEAFGTQQLNLETSGAGNVSTAEAFGTATVATAGPEQTISAAGAIGTAEAFGTSRLDLHTAPSAIASAEAFGTAVFTVDISPSAIASGEAFGTDRLDLATAATGIVSAEAFGSARLDLTALLSAIASAEAFGDSAVTPEGGNQTISPSSVASAEAFGSARADLALAPSGIASAEAFGTDRLDLDLTASAIGGAEAFGGGTVTPGTFTITGAGAIGSLETFGSARIDFVALLSAIASSESFGTAAIQPGPVTISAAGAVASAETFGSHTVSAGGAAGQSVTGVGGIASAETFSDLTLYVQQVSLELPRCRVTIDDDFA